MEKQLNLFARGGLEDEGGEVDEVSGNEVPVGGTKKGVRDDIPAMISEGEFIFPEDVVRYIGLDKLMQLRQEAKMGLKKMEAMGQMGNSDEATMPDDLPFDMADLIIVSSAPQENDEPKKMSRGGMGYQPSIYQGAQINPNQYMPPASAFNPATTQQPFQATSYLPSFAGVPYQTVTGTPRPDTTAEEAIDSIYINVKYINPATGDIRTFKFYEGKPISDIPEGYVPYKEGVDPEDVVKEDVVEEDVVTNVTQVSRDRDDDGAPPPPPPFNWNKATPEAIVNEVNKIKGPAGTIITGLAFGLNPVFGGLAYAATKANEKQTLTKLGEMLKDKNFVKKMSDAGQLKNLKDSLTELQDKTEGKGTVDINFLGVVGSLIKTVTNALKDVLTPKQKQDTIVGAITSAANIELPKIPDQEVEEPTITITQTDPFATSAAAPYFKDDTLTRDGLASLGTTDETDRFATPEGLGSTSVLGDTLVLDNRFRPDRVEITPSQMAKAIIDFPTGSYDEQPIMRGAEILGQLEAPIVYGQSSPTAAKVEISPYEGSVQQAAGLSVSEQMRKMTEERAKQRKQVIDPEFTKGIPEPDFDPRGRNQIPTVEQKQSSLSPVPVPVGLTGSYDEVPSSITPVTAATAPAPSYATMDMGEAGRTKQVQVKSEPKQTATTFSDAFANARKAEKELGRDSGTSTFEYGGNTYTTKLAEDKETKPTSTFTDTEKYEMAKAIKRDSSSGQEKRERQAFQTKQQRLIDSKGDVQTAFASEIAAVDRKERRAFIKNLTEDYLRATGSLNKGGLASKPKKKVTSKKRGLATRK